MAIELFQQLNQTAQADYILQTGVFLHSLQQVQTTTDYYEVDDMLVELCYSHQSDALLSVTAHDIHDWLRRSGRHHLQPRLVIRGNGEGLRKTAA